MLQRSAVAELELAGPADCGTRVPTVGVSRHINWYRRVVYSRGCHPAEVARVDHQHHRSVGLGRRHRHHDVANVRAVHHYLRLDVEAVCNACRRRSLSSSNSSSSSSVLGAAQLHPVRYV